MRIIYFSRGYTPHDHRFLSELSQTNHEIFFLKLQPDYNTEHRTLPHTVAEIPWSGISQLPLSPESLVEVLPEFEATITHISPDVIHAGPIQSCAFIAALSNFTPLLTASWGSDILIDANKNSLWNWVTRFTLRNSDMLFCDCHAVLSKARQLLGNQSIRSIVFPWGIDHGRFSTHRNRLKLRKKLGWEDAQIVISLRTWSSLYGIETALRAFEIAYKKSPNLRLLLIGDGPQRNSVQNFITTKSYESIVHCPGVIPNPDLPEFYAASDIYLSCARSDGASISLLEAMSSGLPVVATDIESNREWIKSGQNGWLAKIDNAEAFADGILHAQNIDSVIRSAISHQNRQTVQKKADWHQNFPQLLQAYEQLATKTKKL